MSRSIEWYRSVGPLKVRFGTRVLTLGELVEGGETARQELLHQTLRLPAVARLEMETRASEKGVQDWESEGGRVA